MYRTFVVFPFLIIAIVAANVSSAHCRTMSADERTVRHVLGRNATEAQVKQALAGFELQKGQEQAHALHGGRFGAPQPRNLIRLKIVAIPPNAPITPINAATHQNLTNPGVTSTSAKGRPAHALAPGRPSAGLFNATSVFGQIGRIIKLCSHQWAAGTCVIDARDPSNPADGTKVQEIVDALKDSGSDSFSNVDIPKTFPTDPPSPSPAQQRVALMRSTIDETLVGNTPRPGYTANPEYERAFHNAVKADPAGRANLAIASPPPLQIGFTNDRYGSAELNIAMSILPPSALAPQSNAVQFGSGICTKATLTLDLLLGRRRYQPKPIDIADLDIEGTYADGTKPSLTVTPTIFGKTGGTLVNLSTKTPLTYDNASVASLSRDLCGITQPFALVDGISITAQLQCEISAGYGAYVDASLGLQRLLVSPTIRSYLIGSIDTSFFGSILRAKAAGRYGVLDVYGQAGLYSRPVHDFERAGPAVPRDAVYLAMAPYAYATGTSGASLVTFTVSALSKNIIFVVGLTPPRKVIQFPTNANSAGEFVAIPTFLNIPNAAPQKCAGEPGS